MGCWTLNSNSWRDRFHSKLFSSQAHSETNKHENTTTPSIAMASDEIIWDIINNQFCSFKIK